MQLQTAQHCFFFFKKKQDEYKELIENKKFFVYKVLTCTYVMSAVEDIEPIAFATVSFFFFFWKKRCNFFLTGPNANGRRTCQPTLALANGLRKQCISILPLSLVDLTFGYNTTAHSATVSSCRASSVQCVCVARFQS